MTRKACNIAQCKHVACDCAVLGPGATRELWRYGHCSFKDSFRCAGLICYTDGAVVTSASITVACDILQNCHDTRLCSTARGDFAVPTTHLRFVDKSFTVAGPKALNSLSETVCNVGSKRTFRRRVQSFLFTQCFE